MQTEEQQQEQQPQQQREPESESGPGPAGRPGAFCTDFSSSFLRFLLWKLSGQAWSVIRCGTIIPHLFPKICYNLATSLKLFINKV